MNPARFVPVRSCAALLFFGFAAPLWADVPLATPEADRQAKFAVPAAEEALLYVYRRDASGPPAVAVSLNGRAPVLLAPRTFAFWKLEPGRAELSAEGAASTASLRAEGGRVYYVELSHPSGGAPRLRQAPFPVGRSQIQRARLVAAAPPAPRATPRPARQRRGHFALALKAGSFELAEESQPILGATRLFDASASSVFALEGEWFVGPDVSLGLELLSYANDYATAGVASGETDTTAVLFNVKRYFAVDRAWQPYLGLGIGAATVDFSATNAGGITGSTGGLALQAAAGVQWRGDRLALRLEYKYLNADTEDDNNQKVDLSGSGLFLGAGIYF